MTVYKDLGEDGGVVLNDPTPEPIIKEDVPFCGKTIKKETTTLTPTFKVDNNDS